MEQRVREHVRKSQTERRQEILDATLELISQHGVEGVTVARIARAVNLTPGALYRHFDSRAALFAEAHRAANQRSVDLVDACPGTEVLKRLENVACAHADWARENFNTLIRPFFMEMASAPDPGVPDRLRFMNFKSFQAVVEMAEEGKRRGEIRPDVVTEDLAWALHMLFWTEDLALMSGEADAEVLAALRRNFKRMLDGFRADCALDEPH
jgi:AcrR family transcriptional regulator